MKTKAQKARKAGRDGRQEKGTADFFGLLIKQKMLFLFCS